MLATLAGALVLCAQTPAAVDHTGETMLKEAFAKSGEIRQSRLIVFKMNRTAGGLYLQDSTLDIWLGGPNQVRIESMSTMGDSTVTVMDGPVTMTDPLSDDEPIHLKKSSPNLEEMSPREPLLWFLAGAPAYDRVVDTTKAIKLLESGDAVEFRTKTFGKIVIGCSPSGLPTRIETYQSGRRRDAGTESEFAVTVERIQVMEYGAISRSLFSVTPAKGRKVEDERTKPPSP